MVASNEDISKKKGNKIIANNIVKPRTLKVTLVCDEFNIADVLRDFANYIEESDLDYSKNPQFEGDNYEGEIEVTH